MVTLIWGVLVSGISFKYKSHVLSCSLDCSVASHCTRVKPTPRSWPPSACGAWRLPTPSFLPALTQHIPTSRPGAGLLPTWNLALTVPTCPLPGRLLLISWVVAGTSPSQSTLQTSWLCFSLSSRSSFLQRNGPHRSHFLFVTSWLPSSPECAHPGAGIASGQFPGVWSVQRLPGGQGRDRSMQNE